MGGSENPSPSMETKHKALSSHLWVTSVTASHERLLSLKTFSPVWPGTHCDRAAAGGSVDRKEIPEPSLLILMKKNLKPVLSLLPSGLLFPQVWTLKMSLQLCIPGITSPDTESIARLSWETRDAGQNQLPTLLTQDHMWLGHSHWAWQ